MRTHTIGVLVASLVLALASLLPGPARAQMDSAQQAVQDSSSKPIGKVVTATGLVTIEHASAVVLQANVSAQAGQTKVGDLVYQGDVVQTGADGRVGINFADGTSFNLSSSARMVLNEFVYDPNGKSNSTLFNLTKGTFTFVAGNIAKTGECQNETCDQYTNRMYAHDPLLFEKILSCGSPMVAEAGALQLRRGHFRRKNIL